MKVYIGTDHNGYALKARIVDYLKKNNVAVADDSGPLNPDDDYPVFAKKVALDMLGSQDPEPRGILLCGSGQGMCMAANRYKGIRAALGYNKDTIISARNDDDANVLCLPAKTLDSNEAFEIIDAFLKTPFGTPVRFKRRVQEMDDV